MKNLILAGAGAGKTRRLVTEVRKILPDLSKTPYRYCAVVTYTKAATEVIRKRLSNRTVIPKNVFIGTTHSFLIRFIVEPYAHLLTDTPASKSYIDKIDLPKWMKDWFVEKSKNADQRKAMIKNKEIKTVSELCENGLITCDKILELADFLTDNNEVCNSVAERLRFFFVDEYQDTRVIQHRVFNKILSEEKTYSFYIGDPLQSIYNFTYLQSQIKKTLDSKPESFSESPILEIVKDEQCNLNCFSSEEIRRIGVFR